MSLEEPPEDGLDDLLEYLRRTRGFHVGGYKRVSLRRRIERRLQALSIGEPTGYVDYLEVHPEEFAHLFDSILINVTDFFRDPPAWEALAAEALPQILAGKGPDEPIRAWSAGCATGAEPFTLAIVLAEALGLDAFRERVKIYATDLDDGALSQARQASFVPREMQGVPPDLLARYFDQVGDRWFFHKDLRRAIIFGRHDLMQDAPISRVDLLVCRNTLMYFNAEMQARILERFHFALNERGFLFLGKAETLLRHNHLFTAVDIKRRIFTKVPRGFRRPHAAAAPAASPRQQPDSGNLDVLRQAAFDRAPFPQIVIDSLGRLALVNDPARSLFGLGSKDVGVPLQDLQISYRPADLRSGIDQAYADRRSIALEGVKWPHSGGGTAYYDIHFVPLMDPARAPLGIAITFADVSEARLVRDELERSALELETAQEALQSANEELETTNEELQSTNEELETTNEELQSANEELETTNEELQSTNEELETVNEEMSRKGDDLRTVNVFLEAVLASLGSGVAVVDSRFLVRAWNPRAEDLWGLRADEVRGKPLLALDIGLPVEALKRPLQACLDGSVAADETRFSAINRRGRAIACKVTCTPMRDEGEIRGVVVVMDEYDGTAEPVARALSDGHS